MSHILYAEQAFRACELAITTGLGVCLFGPPGHAKSMILEEIVARFAQTGASVWVKSMNSQTSELDLFGGLREGALERGVLDDYNHERGFQGADVAVFEELFDAPPRVLCALKEALTSRVVRGGREAYGLRTKVILAATNHDPSEVAEMDASVEALVSRFPIQWNVVWPRYNAETYLELFESLDSSRSSSDNWRISWPETLRLQGMAKSVQFDRDKYAQVADLLGRLAAENPEDETIPRTAVYLYRAIKASAALAGRQRVEWSDIAETLPFFGLSQEAESLEKSRIEIRVQVYLEEVKGIIQEVEKQMRSTNPGGRPANNPIGWLRLAKQCKHFADTLGYSPNFYVPDKFFNRKNELVERLGSLGVECQQKAVEVTTYEVTLPLSVDVVDPRSWNK